MEVLLERGAGECDGTQGRSTDASALLAPFAEVGVDSSHVLRGHVDSMCQRPSFVWM